MISTSTGSVPMGTILPFLGPEIPSGWLLCDGSDIPSGYSTFISFLGSTRTPNLAGRTLIGTGIPDMGVQSDGNTPNYPPSANWPLGYTGGEFQHTLTIPEIPAHDHGYTYDNPLGAHAGDYYSGSYWQPISVQSTTQSTGGGQPHYNMQPYYAVNFIIYAGPAE